jgi:transcriptional regulator GlxA family with amidase domain
MWQDLAMHRVVVLALDGVIPFELGIPLRIFGGAADVRGQPLYEVSVCSVDGAPVRTDAGLAIAVEHDAGELVTADTVIIPPVTALSAIIDQGALREPVAGALARIRPGTRVVSICTGAYVLAAAGLLDGRPATTHWREAEHLQRTFPAVRVDPGVLFVDDGDVLTSAGAAAGVDLCLHLIRRDHGSDVANRVARDCVVPPWREGGQAQYIRHPVPGPSTTSTAATRTWVLEHLDDTLALSELAEHARMSVRTFTRRFSGEVGMPPGQWLTAQRIERARQLLETSDLTIDHIATQAGFATGRSFRHHFRAAVGTSPSTYRRSFRPRVKTRTG